MNRGHATHLVRRLNRHVVQRGCIAVFVFLVLLPASKSWAQLDPQSISDWDGLWSAVVRPNEHQMINITLELKVHNGSLSGSFSGGGQITGSASSANASGSWHSPGREGGRFSLNLLNGNTRFGGNWGGEGGGNIQAKKALAARPEDCPSFIVNMVLDDANDEIDKKCENVRVNEHPYGFNKDNDDRLERFLRGRPELLGRNGAAPSAIGAACRTRLANDPRLRSSVVDSIPETMAKITAEYYASRKSLDDAIHATLENMAALDSLRSMDCELTSANPSGFASAKNQLLRGQICSELGSLAAVRTCERLKNQCSQNVDYSGIVERSEIAMRQIEVIEAEIDRGGHDEEMEKALEGMKAGLEGTSKWLTGEHFNDRYDKELNKCKAEPHIGPGFCDAVRKKFICRGIRSEARQIRKALSKQLDEYNHALRCVEGNAPESCDQREVREVIAKAPPAVGVPATEEMLESGGTSRERDTLDSIYANSQLAGAECRRKMRKIDNNINDAYVEFATGTALTVATLGMGSAVALARASASAANVAKVAGATSRLSSMAHRAVAATRLSPRAFTLAALGLDLADMGRGLAHSIEQCGDVFSLASTATKSSDGPSMCPGATDYQGAHLTSDYQDCVLKAVAFEGSMGLLPMAPAGIGKLLDKRALKKAGQTLGGEVLRGSKRDAILSVFRRFTKMMEADLDDAIAQLRKAGFDDRDIQRLITSMAPNVRNIDGKLVVGLEGKLLSSTKLKGHLLCLTDVGGRLKLSACSNCDDLRKIYKADLANNPTLKKHFEEVETALRKAQASGDKAARTKAFRQLESVTEGLEKSAKKSFLNNTGLGEALPDSELRLIADAFESGKITKSQLRRIAAAADEAHWAKLSGLSNREFNARLKSAKDVFDAVKPMDRELRRLLKSRMEESIRTGRVYLGGGDAKSLFHSQLSFQRTTPDVREYAKGIGEYRNPKTGQVVIIKPGDAIEADHVYPIHEIINNRRLKDFHSLPQKFQKEVVYNTKNIKPLPAKLNGSKGNKLAKEWSESIVLDEGYWKALQREQNEIEEILLKQIECLKGLAAHHDPSKCR